MRKPRKKYHLYLDVQEIPPKINEIISYLSMDFSKNNLFERDDLAQDLYTLYAQMLAKDKDAVKQQPGWFFIKFKWYLLTKWSKRVKEIEREWKYKRMMGMDFPDEEAPITDAWVDERLPYSKKRKSKKE